MQSQDRKIFCLKRFLNLLEEFINVILGLTIAGSDSLTSYISLYQTVSKSKKEGKIPNHGIWKNTFEVRENQKHEIWLSMLQWMKKHYK